MLLSLLSTGEIPGGGSWRVSKLQIIKHPRAKNISRLDKKVYRGEGSPSVAMRRPKSDHTFSWVQNLGWAGGVSVQGTGARFTVSLACAAGGGHQPGATERPDIVEQEIHPNFLCYPGGMRSETDGERAGGE